MTSGIEAGDAPLTICSSCVSMELRFGICTPQRKRIRQQHGD
jgi:hypothetical protein